jgi:hypothetical protein
VKFLKQHKLFTGILFLCFAMVTCLQIVSCNSSDNLESIISAINKETRLLQSYKEDSLHYEGLSEDSESAMQDLRALAEIEKDQHRFWNGILDQNQNIASTWKNKSPESINADLTRLYTQLRETCKKNNIDLGEEESNSLNPFGENNENENKYGFGLSSYDGFWPSFSRDEAKLLGIQSKIVGTLIEYLSEAASTEHRITLIQILRETVGKEDSQHITSDKLIYSNLPQKLVRFTGGIQSFAFLIKFKCHTSHARSFINQLRPPFLLRDLVVSRTLDGITQGTSPLSTGPFSTTGIQDNMKTPLPIVQNVESTFTLLIEYIYQVDRDFETFIKQSLKNEKKDKGSEEILKILLEISGNNKIKINNIFTNREVR